MRNIKYYDINYDDENGIKLLKSFYDDIFCTEFPDPDERDLWSDILDYLSNSHANSINAYHYYINIMVVDNVVAGGAIFDYLPGCNWGVIEYIALGSGFVNAKVDHRC